MIIACAKMAIEPRHPQLVPPMALGAPDAIEARLSCMIPGAIADPILPASPTGTIDARMEASGDAERITVHRPLSPNGRRTAFGANLRLALPCLADARRRRSSVASRSV